MCIITNVRAMDSTKASDLNEINKRKEEKYIYIERKSSREEAFQVSFHH